MIFTRFSRQESLGKFEGHTELEAKLNVNFLKLIAFLRLLGTDLSGIPAKWDSLIDPQPQLTF